jgi:hypothetical protein
MTVTYTLRIEKQGVKQLKALLKFTPPAGDRQVRYHSFGVCPEGVVATDGYTLGIANVGAGIRWHGDPADLLSVNGKTLVQMLPADGATVEFANGNFKVTSAHYESQGIVDDIPWMDWRTLVPADTGETHPAGFVNPTLLGRFGALTDATVGKPNQPVIVKALHPQDQVKPLRVEGETGLLLGLLMPMRVG